MTSTSPRRHKYTGGANTSELLGPFLENGWPSLSPDQDPQCTNELRRTGTGANARSRQERSRQDEAESHSVLTLAAPPEISMSGNLGQ